jgi:hypothetical protein
MAAVCVDTFITNISVELTQNTDRVCLQAEITSFEEMDTHMDTSGGRPTSHDERWMDISSTQDTITFRITP